MTLFVSSAWGFDPERWSALGFSREGVRDKLQRQWRQGDRMLIIGTKGDETPEGERGRLLGIVDVTTRSVNSWDLVRPDLIAEHDSRGTRNKWRFGMPYKSAERFTAPLPRVEDIIPRIYHEGLGMQAAANFLPLNPDEEDAVLALPRTEAEVYVSERAAALHADGAWRHRLNVLSKGPPPSLQSYEVTRQSGPACVYVLRFEGPLSAVLGKLSAPLGPRELWKVGWAFDPVRRARVINNHMPSPDVCGWRLQASLTITAPDAKDAYVLEQRVLETLKLYRHRGEMVLCTSDQIRAAMASAPGKPPSDQELASADAAFSMAIATNSDDAAIGETIVEREAVTE